MDTQQLNQEIQKIIDSQTELICRAVFYEDQCQLVFLGYPRNVAAILKEIDVIKWKTNEEAGIINGISKDCAAQILNEITHKTGIKFDTLFIVEDSREEYRGGIAY